MDKIKTYDINFQPNENLNNINDKIKTEDVGINLSNTSIADIDELVFKNSGVNNLRNINVGSTGIGESQYDTGISLGQLNLTPLESIRADRQGVFSQLANAIGGGAVSGAIGAVEGFSNIADQVMNIGNEATEWERGAVSQILADLKTDVNELTPLYRKDRGDTFDWNDSGFYFEVLKGAVDSAVAFGVPGAAYGSAVGKLGNLLGKAELFGRRLDVLTRAAGRAAGVANLDAKLGAGTAAMLSNYNEGTVMGLQTYDEEKERFTKVLTQDALLKQKEAGVEVPTLTEQDFKNIEMEASLQAGQAAEAVRDINHFMVASNYISVKGLFKPTSTASRAMVTKPGFKSWLSDQALAAPAEGIEEVAQGVIQREVSFETQDDFYKRNGIDTTVPNEAFNDYNEVKNLSFGDRLVDFATRDEVLLEGMMGLISGPIQYAVTGLPGRSKLNEQQSLRYVQQQGLIGRNTEFINDKLTYQQTTDELLGSFDQFNKEILGKQEWTEEDETKYNALIENTAFDTLAVQNFFGGTTADLEKQLQGVVTSESATQPEKDAAQKHLERLGELETRFNKYSQYQDGAHMFATQLRSERLSELVNTLDTAYAENEKKLTEVINGKLAKKSKNKKLAKPYQLEDLLFFEDEVTTIDADGKDVVTKVQTPVRSVSQAINGITAGKQLMSRDGRVFSTKEFKEGNAFELAINNRQVKNRIQNTQEIYSTTLDESKSLNYENEFAKYQDAINTADSKERLTKLKDFKTLLDTKYKEDKYKNLKARTTQDIRILDKAIKGAEQVQTQTESQVSSVQAEEAKKNKVSKKKGEVTETVPLPTTEPTDTIDSITPTSEPAEPTFDASGYPEIDLFDGPSSNPIIQAAEAKALEQAAKTQPTPVTPVTPPTPVDKATAKKALIAKMKALKESLMKSGKTAEQAEAIILKRLPPEDLALRDEIIAEKAKKSVTVETKQPEVIPEVSTPQLLGDEDKQTTLENFEAKPTGKDDNKIAQQNVKQISNVATTLIEGDGTDDGTRAKLMTTGGTETFESKVLKNFKDKTGLQADVIVTPLFPKDMDGKSRELAIRALDMFTKAKATGTYSASDFDFMVKYLPIAVDFGSNAVSFIYPMNWKNDTSINPKATGKYADQQNQGETTIRKQVITAGLKGNKMKITVKGQLPGTLNFGTEEKMLAEMNGFIENPMNVKMFISIDGYLHNANKADTYNPFTETFMTYDTKLGKEPWLGIFVIEVKALNGMSFPLKVNTKNHNDASADIVYDLYKAMVTGTKKKNLMKVSIKQNDPELFSRIKSLLPGLVTTYGEDVTYSDAISDMVYEGDKTKGRVSELYFDQGKVYFSGNALTASDFSNPANRAKFVEFIKEFKTFNVNVAKLNDPEYRKHVFTNYLSTNANIDDMFTADGTLNPNGDSVQRMKSGAMYVDVTSLKEEVVDKPTVKEEVITPSSPETVLDDKVEKEFESQDLSDAESGITGITGAEIAALKQQQSSLLPDPDPDSMSYEEYKEIEAEVKKSKEWKKLQKQIEDLQGKPKTQPKPKNKVEKIKEAQKQAEVKAKETDRCKINADAAKKAAKGFGDLGI